MGRRMQNPYTPQRWRLSLEPNFDHSNLPKALIYMVERVICWEVTYISIKHALLRWDTSQHNTSQCLTQSHLSQKLSTSHLKAFRPCSGSEIGSKLSRHSCGE